MTGILHAKWLKPIVIILGGFLYAFGMNIFVIPFKLFSGGAVGLSQILTVFLGKLVYFGNVNLYGIIYIVLNIPLLFLAWKSMGKNFFIKTILGAGSISAFMSLLPIPSVPVIQDCLASVLIGGILTGAATGLILVSGGCGGGFDIIGVWASKKYKNASVGKVTLVANLFIYVILLLMFDIQTVIYSLILMVFSTFMLDKIHYQNINIRLMIFTKKEGIDRKILEQTGRGVTEWKGTGAYTNEDTRILVSCVNKYEQSEFMDIIYGLDPHAFVIADEGVYVTGNFEKRV